MAKALVSPGVSVSVTDESFYASADARATVPLVVIATRQDKLNPSGTGVAKYTTKAQAGKPQLITSARELLQQFGNPEFRSVNGRPLHADELNEYGLLTAYRILNQIGRVWVIRADVDLNSLTPSDEPKLPIQDNGYWFDTAHSDPGIYRFRVNSGWTKENVIMITDNNDIDSATGMPQNSVGHAYDIAINAISDYKLDKDNPFKNGIYQKLGEGAATQWYVLGSDDWKKRVVKAFRSNVFADGKSHELQTPYGGSSFTLRKNGVVISEDGSGQPGPHALFADVTGKVTVDTNQVDTLPIINTTSLNAALITDAAKTVPIDASSTDTFITYEIPLIGANALDVTKQITVRDTAGNTDITLSATNGSTTLNTLINDLFGVISGGTHTYAVQLGSMSGVTFTAESLFIVIRKIPTDSVVYGDVSFTGAGGPKTVAPQQSNARTMVSVAAQLSRQTVTNPATENDLSSDTIVFIVQDAGMAHLLLRSGNSTAVYKDIANSDFLHDAGFDVDDPAQGVTFRASLKNIQEQMNDNISDPDFYVGYNYVKGTGAWLTFEDKSSANGALISPFELSGPFMADLGITGMKFVTPTIGTEASLGAGVRARQFANSIWINTSELKFNIKVYDAKAGKYNAVAAPAYASSNEALDAFRKSNSLRQGVVFVEPVTNPQSMLRSLEIVKHNGLPSTTVTLRPVNLGSKAVEFKLGVGSNMFDVAPTYDPSNASIIRSLSDVSRYVAAAINNSRDLAANGFVARVSNAGDIVITQINGYDINIAKATRSTGANENTVFGKSIFNTYSNWELLDYIASPIEPTTDPVGGTVWFDGELTSNNIDLLVNKSSTSWETYTGSVIVSVLPPKTNTLTNTPLQDDDIWVSTADLEDIPTLYRYKAGAWVQIDVTDQTTEAGILFADVRPNNKSSLDDDAPEASFYPNGMLLWNTRASGMVVKEYGEVGKEMRWKTISSFRDSGAPLMGRKAQRSVVVKAMQEALLLEELRSTESRFFNLGVAPGYPELIDDLVQLSKDRKETMFVVGDTPARLKPIGSDIQAWGKNSNGASQTGEDGLILANPLAGVYYPWGLSTNVDGSNVMVPASMIAMQAIIYSDNVSYPWYAPAGFTRGQVGSTFASVGYLTDEDEYQPTALSEGLRDVLYTNKINPIAEIPGRGLVVYGQKTLSAISSARDRINVERLLVYLRYQFQQLAMPFLFEINDELTRDSVYQTFDKFLSEIVGLRGIYDYLIVVDSSNNTPERIDRNELWIDILISPSKAIEMIYIPVRVKNTGDI